MIQSLLSRFKTNPAQYCKLSLSGERNSFAIANLSFFYANKAIMLFTLSWLGFIFISYNKIIDRPVEFFEPAHFFGKLLMPSFPEAYLYYSIIFIATILTLSLLFYKDTILIRSILIMCALWLNVLLWSYGMQSAVANTLLLSHIFGIFIPFNKILENKTDKEIYSSIEWYYFGILITYVYSGVWKWIGLVYKSILKPNEINWLDPHAAQFQSLIGYHYRDASLESISDFFVFPLFWQISFLLMSFILTFCLFAAFRQPLRMWVGLSLVIFHLVNGLAFDIWFNIAMLVLTCLFIPYEIFFKKISLSLEPIIKKEFIGNRLGAKYTRYYENGDIDEFFGFYAYREMMYDKNVLLGGILYTPFVDICVELIWSILAKFQMKTIFNKT